MLTQVINNLSRTGETIQTFSGLPPKAIPIQHNVQNAIDVLLPDIKQMQHEVTSWGLKLEAQLDEKLAVLESLSPAELALFIRQSKKDISRVTDQVKKVKESTKNTDNTVIENNKALQRIIINLQESIASLESDLQGSQQKLEALNKQKLIFVAMGMLGLSRLSILMSQIFDMQNKVGQLVHQIQLLQFDIRQQQSFVTQTGAFSQGLLVLSNQMLRIDNTIEMISNDIRNAEKNVSGGEAQQLTKLFFTAAKMSVRTLLVDAS
ncbi:hypothetical protein [Serratia inhibens]|uniref:hypothetical protein n=1 Tax=Serratia inhibens TaxID=2338073 RepID=UPI0002EADE19|nr:hypothetical protein [Serratia inhibens]